MTLSRIFIVASIVLVGAIVGCEKKPLSAPEPTAAQAQQWPGAIRIVRPALPSILIEAEAGEIKPPMQVFEDTAASGGKYVLAPEGPQHKEVSVGGSTSIRFQVAKEGEYSLWFRTRWCCDCGNSLAIRLDGQELKDVEDSVLETWHWVPLRDVRVRLEAGEHFLVVTSREDGAALDQILLTQDRDYRPTGIELPDVPERTSGVPVSPRAEPPTTTLPQQ